MGKHIRPPSAHSATSYTKAQAILDGVDEAARQMEAKWGVGRLRLLVSDVTRARFDNQIRIWNEAIWTGDLATVREKAERMKRAWAALDSEAEKAGAQPLSPDVWETRLSDGRVLAITRTSAEAFAAAHADRNAVVWTVDELARIVEAQENKIVNAARASFPEAIVEAVRGRSLPSISKSDDNLLF